MIKLDIDKIDSKFMLTENSTENAVLSYLWDIIQNVPVEEYLQEAAKDANVSTTLAYLRLSLFVPFFLRASDIVWEFDDGGDRTYSFNDYFKLLIVDDEQIKPYTLNVIKNCLQKQNLINLSDFDVSIEDEDFYNEEKWSFFNELAYCFSVQNYLKSVHINTLTVLFSNITDTEDAQNLANSIYAPINDDAPFGLDEDSAENEYEHEFESKDEFVEFLVKYADKLIPKAPTYTQCHLYSYLNGDCD